MAEEDQDLRKFAEALKTFTSLVESDTTRFKRSQNEYLQALRQGSINLKEYNRLTRSSARSYAQAQIEETKAARSLTGVLESSVGSMKLFNAATIQGQRNLLRLNSGLQSMGAIISGFGSAGRAIAEGKTSFDALSPIIDGMAKAFEAIPGLGTAAKLAAEGAKYLLNQMQQATETFQKLGAVGALTTEGMSGVQKQFLRSGMSLDGFRRAVTENAATLARFGGTAGRGAEDFSRIVGQVLDSDVGDQLRRLGYTADAFGEAAAGYIDQQSRLGIAQTRTNAQLAKGAATYAQELDTLAKLTGMQREEIQKQQAAAMSESRFRAQLDEMIAQGREGEAKALLDFQTMVSKASPEMAQGLRDLATGNATTEAAQQVLRMGGQRILEDVKSGIIGPVDAFKQMQKATQDNLPTMRGLARAVGDETKAFTKYAEASDLANAKIVDGQVVLAEQNRQMAKGNDQLTDNTVGAQKSMEQMNRQLQNLAFSLLPSFSKVVAATTDAMRAGLQKLGVTLPSEAGGAPAGGGAPAAGGRRGLLGSNSMFRMGGGGGASSAQDLAAAGLIMKQGDVQAQGSVVNPRLISLAKQIQSDVPGFSYFSGFNDRFHQENAPSSAHTQGLAADFAVNPPPTAEQGQAIVNQLKGMGFATVIDEYNNPSRRSTGGHFHAAIQAATGGVFAGPSSGYSATLHGTEAIVPLPDGKTIPVEMPNLDRSMEQQVSMMGAQLIALEEMVRYMRENTSISAKILQAANN